MSIIKNALAETPHKHTSRDDRKGRLFRRKQIKFPNVRTGLNQLELLIVMITQLAVRCKYNTKNP